jgi:predicted phage tail protein
VTRLQVDLTAAKGTIEQLTITKENFERQLTEERKMVKRLMSNEAKAVQQAQQLMIEAQRERSEAAALAQQMQFESVTASTEAALAKQDAERSRQLMVQRSQHLETTTQQLADHHRQLTERQQAVFSSAMERVAQRDSEAIRQMAAVNFEGVRLALQAGWHQQRTLELEMEHASVEAQQQYLGYQQQLHVVFAQQLRIDVHSWMQRLQLLDTQRGMEWRLRVDEVNETIIALLNNHEEVKRIDASIDRTYAIEFDDWKKEPENLLALTAQAAHTMVGNLLLEADGTTDAPQQQLLLTWHNDLPTHFQ